MTGLRITAAVEGRFDDRLAPAQAGRAGFMSATDLALTTWDATSDPPTIVAEDRAPEPWAGPLVADGDRVAWGPMLLDGDPPRWGVDDLVRAAAPEFGEAAPRRFQLQFGAASTTTSHVVVALRRIEARVQAGRARPSTGPPARWAVLATATMTPVFSQDAAITTALWDGATLRAGEPSTLLAWSASSGLEKLTIDDHTAPRALAHAGKDDGRWWAGMASGHVITFERARGMVADAGLHSGPVTALAFRPEGDQLASGGTDGRLVVHSGGDSVGALDFGEVVEALVWLADGRLVAKAGGPAGRLFVVTVDQ